jgi:DNA-binding response OmpR family regulator
MSKLVETLEPATREAGANKLARGFALYVGISEREAAQAGLSLAEIAAALRLELARLVPQGAAESYAAVALAPAERGGSNLELTRLALKEPRAVARAVGEGAATRDEPAPGVVIDLGRRKVFVDGRNASFTSREFELVAHLVKHQGETIGRAELSSVGGQLDQNAQPVQRARTVDVHIRRLRAKLGIYQDIVRTVRGDGYRFDAHPDVLVEGA